MDASSSLTLDHLKDLTNYLNLTFLLVAAAVLAVIVVVVVASKASPWRIVPFGAVFLTIAFAGNLILVGDVADEAADALIASASSEGVSLTRDQAKPVIKALADNPDASQVLPVSLDGTPHRAIFEVIDGRILLSVQNEPIGDAALELRKVSS